MQESKASQQEYLKQLVHRGYFDYAQKTGLKLFRARAETSHRYYQCFVSDNPPSHYPYGGVLIPPGLCSEVSDLNTWMDQASASVYMSKKTEEDFKLHFITEHPQLCKSLYSTLYWTINFTEHHESVFRSWHKMIPKTLEFIHTLPLEAFKITTGSLEGFDQVMKDMNFNDEQRHKFWFQFFKKRQTHLKDIKKASIAANFITQIHGTEPQALEPFLSFFPLLGQFLESIDKKPLDFFEPTPSLSTFFTVNYASVAQHVFNPAMNESSYASLVKSFIDGLAEFLNVKTVKFEENEKQKTLNALFLHDNHEITHEKIRRHLQDFVEFVAQNQQITTMQPSEVKKWLAHQELSTALEHKPASTAKARKI